MTTTTPHDVLGVGVNPTIEEIKRAYRLRSLETHPDRGGDSAAFRAVKDAYETLMGHPRSTRTRPRPNTSTNTGAKTTGPTAAPGPAPTPTFGTPGRVDTADFGVAGDIGAQGERRVADLLAHAGLPEHAFLFNSVQLGDRGGDMDHVILVGHHALFIDTKTWAAGNYTFKGDMVFRDGEPFPPGLVKSTAAMANITAKRLDIPPENVSTYVAYTDLSGRSNNHRIDLSHDRLHFVGVDDLVQRVRGWAAGVEYDHGVLAIPPERIDKALSGTDFQAIHIGPRDAVPDPTGSDTGVSAAFRFAPVLIGAVAAAAAIVPMAWLFISEMLLGAAPPRYDILKAGALAGLVALAAHFARDKASGFLDRKYVTPGTPTSDRGKFRAPQMAFGPPILSGVAAAVLSAMTFSAEGPNWFLASVLSTIAVATIIGVGLLARHAHRADLHRLDEAGQVLHRARTSYNDPARQVNSVRWDYQHSTALREHRGDSRNEQYFDSLWSHLRR